MSAPPQHFHNVLQALARRRWALWLLLATGCNSRSALNLHGADSSVDSGGATSEGGVSGQGGDGNAAVGVSGGVTGSGGLTGSGGNISSGGLTGSGGVTRTGGVADTGGVFGTGGAVGTGGPPGSGGSAGSGGLTGSGGVTRTGVSAGTGGIVGSGGAVGRGGTLGSGGIGGSGGTIGSSGVFGMLCTTNQDCPSDAICCDGSDPSCDGTRLPSGDVANSGELVVSTDGLTVTDTITGLVWQRDVSGTRAGCSGIANMSCLWAEAQAYCASLVLGGLSGWRLPAWMELLTIVDFTAAIATIDQTAFPNTPTSRFWTSSQYIGVSSYLYVDFSDGTSTNCAGFSDYNSMRCVRGSRCYPTSRYVVLDGGLVRDTLTGLVWQQQGSTTKMTWADAQSYCSALGSDFRLPTLKELDSLVDPTVTSGPTLDQTAFPSTVGEAFWTSTPYTDSYPVDSSDKARFGNFRGGTSDSCESEMQNWTNVGDSLNVRCVR